MGAYTLKVCAYHQNTGCREALGQLTWAKCCQVPSAWSSLPPRADMSREDTGPGTRHVNTLSVAIYFAGGALR